MSETGPNPFLNRTALKILLHNVKYAMGTMKSFV